MPNLNYSDVSQDDTQDDTQGGTQGDTQENRILILIRGNNTITTSEIAEKMGISVSTVKRKIKHMDNVKYVGSGYSGHWEIVE